jgi:hypothetical protein
MNRFIHILVSALALVLSACGGSGTPNPNPNPQPSNQLAGTYNGSFIIDVEPFVSAKTTFTIDNAGKVAGTTTSEEPTDVVGEKGTLTGTARVDSSGFTIVFDLNYASPTLGAYSNIRGSGIYASTTKQIAASALTVKNASGTFIGDMTITATKE